MNHIVVPEPCVLHILQWHLAKCRKICYNAAKFVFVEDTMNEDILALIQDKFSTFSKGQKRIATFITEEYDKAAFMTAAKLGQTTNVSESTVVRFATELGYSGYPAMQKAMQEMVLNRLTSAQRLEIANDRMGQDVVTTVLQSDAEKLRQTAETIDRDDFSTVVNAVLRAKRIYLLGVRSAAALANFAGYYLNYMFSNVKVITTSGAGEMFEQLVNVEEDDVVLAFSFPRYSTATIKAAQYCRSVGATVISITNSYGSPLAQCGDYVLVAKSDMASFADSLVAPLSLVNALLVALSVGREETLEKNFDTLERVWEEYHIYEKQVKLP